MDISSEIAAIQAASQGSELRQPLVGALNKLNSGSLPAVTASDAGKILKVGANGWEVGEKSGYMPVPTATKQITENGTHDVTDYASAVVNVSGGGGSVLIPKTITQNGTYDPADDNADGYSEVTVSVEGGGSAGRLYIIDPDVLALCYNNGTYDSATARGAWLYPFIGINNDTSGNIYKTPTQTTRSYNGTTKPCIYRNGMNVGTYCFPSIKVPGGKYNKLCVQIEVTSGFGSAYPTVCIVCTPNAKPSSNISWDNEIKRVYLSNPDMSAAQIVAQTGVTIACTTKGIIPPQVVEIDISSIQDDFYFGIIDCDRAYYLWSVYVE